MNKGKSPKDMIKGYLDAKEKDDALFYDTYEEAKAVKEGLLLDIEKTRFSIRTQLNN